MTNIINLNSFYNETYSIDTEVISRICNQILSRIDDKIHKLTIEQHSMKQILLSSTYPEKINGVR